MRLATGFLIALVACLWLGLAEAASPPAAQTGACPKACNKASACDKATACSKEKEAACSTATACNKASACNKATACNKTAATACAGKNACDAASACPGEKSCEGAASKDAVMAAMFGDMVICGKVLQCSQLTTSAETVACEASCETAAGCETACASKKACCEAGASCEKVACQQAACAKATACASKLTCASACNKSTACSTATACNKSTACRSATACNKATACESAAGCPATACAATGECPQVIATDGASGCESGNCCKAKAAALAVASDETCAGSTGCSASACCPASDCASDACPSAACPNTVKLAHLVKAAEHLAAAGLTDEADCVRAMAVEVRQELVAKKVAQIASLQAEIAALGGDCESACDGGAAPCHQEPAQTISAWMDAPRKERLGVKASKQVAVNVKCVEVSLSMMKKLGFSIETVKPNDWEKGDAKGILGFMHALEREHLVKVLACPTATLPDGGGFQVAGQELGLLKVQANLLDNQHVRMEIQHTAAPFIAGSGPAGRDISPGNLQEFNTGIELEFGKTAVFGGQVRDRITAEQDPNTHEPKMVRSEVQTLILVTPKLVEPATAVQPASHEEPSDASGAMRRQIKSIRILDHVPGQPQPRTRYSFPAETR